MKKFTFIMTLLAVMTGMSSCKYYTQCDCPQNGGNNTCYFNSKVIELNAPKSTWQKVVYEDGSEILQASFDVPELKADICKYGSVTCYAYYQDNGVESQLQLPAITHLYLGKDDEGIEYFGEEKIEFLYGTGWVTINVDYDNLLIEDGDARDRRFRLVMMW